MIREGEFFFSFFFPYSDFFVEIALRALGTLSLLCSSGEEGPVIDFYIRAAQHRSLRFPLPRFYIESTYTLTLQFPSGS